METNSINELSREDWSRRTLQECVVKWLAQYTFVKYEKKKSNSPPNVRKLAFGLQAKTFEATITKNWSERGVPSSRVAVFYCWPQWVWESWLEISLFVHLFVCLLWAGRWRPVACPPFAWQRKEGMPNAPPLPQVASASSPPIPLPFAPQSDRFLTSVRWHYFWRTSLQNLLLSMIRQYDNKNSSVMLMTRLWGAVV